MKNFILILFLFSINWSYTQDTINERYGFNYKYAIFGSVQPSDSAYYVKSILTDDILAVHDKDAFIKFNLDGTLDTLKILEFDSLGVNSWESTNFIKTHDGGFAQFVRTVSNTQEAFMFIKYNELGDTIKTNYITDFNQPSTYFSKKPYTFIQNPDSTYLGVASVNDYIFEIHSYSGIVIFELDKNGELLWFKTIFNDNLSYYPFLGGNDLIQYNDTLMILASTESHSVSGNNSEDESRLKFFFMDTLANVYNTRTYTNDSLMSCNAIVKTMDNGLLYCGSTGRYDPPTNGHDYKGLITKLDSNFDIEWQIVLGEWKSYFGMHFENLVKVTDNEYVAVGVHNHYINTDTLVDVNSYGWLVKFNLQGEVLWERKFNKVPNTPFHYTLPKHELLDIKMTKDSGFVMVGQSVNYYDDIPGHPKGQLGWLVKTDKYGCLVPGCQLYDNIDTTKVDTTDTTVWVSEPVELYPNPASTNLFYYFAQPTDDFKPCIAQIFNLQGQLIQEFSLSTNHVTYMIDVSQYASGMYIFKVITPQQETLKTTRFLVAH